jgi:proteasome accessory factor B
MARNSARTIEDRLQRILAVLRANHQLTESEISALMGVDRRTVNNYLRELSGRGWVRKDKKYWRAMHKRPSTRQLSLEPSQTVLLYLAMRLFVKQSDRRVVASEMLLVRLAEILSRDHAIGSDLLTAARELGKRPVEPGYEDLLSDLSLAYVTRKRVEMLYQSASGTQFSTLLAPYLLEPSTFGFATYVIGHSSISDAVRTFKVERIQKLTITSETYAVPVDFPGRALLENAWSIYYGDELIDVTLRFDPLVARRVQETHWRGNATITPDPIRQDYVRMSLQVSDTTDLKPWIRGWGGMVEVLEPVELRREMADDALRLSALYVDDVAAD